MSGFKYFSSSFVSELGQILGKWIVKSFVATHVQVGATSENTAGENPLFLALHSNI